MTDERIEALRRGFEAWERGDAEAAMATYHPEVVVYASPEVGNPGTFRGHAGFLEWSQAWYDAWETFEQELGPIETVGETHLIADVKQRATGRGSGVVIERDATWVFELREGTVIYIALYFKREHALADAQAREAAD
jgi:ketosteroid isomerase-like protein